MRTAGPGFRIDRLPRLPLDSVDHFFCNRKRRLVKVSFWRPFPDTRRRPSSTTWRAGSAAASAPSPVVYSRWDKFDFRRELAMVIERSLRETLSDETTGHVRPQPNPTYQKHDCRAAVAPPFLFATQSLPLPQPNNWTWLGIPVPIQLPTRSVREQHRQRRLGDAADARAYHC
jgi:hypothetical protein